jgi:hypothetical protein
MNTDSTSASTRASIGGRGSPKDAMRSEGASALGNIRPSGPTRPSGSHSKKGAGLKVQGLRVSLMTGSRNNSGFREGCKILNESPQVWNESPQG